jgi:hypothetical protein
MGDESLHFHMSFAKIPSLLQLKGLLEHANAAGTAGMRSSLTPAGGGSWALDVEVEVEERTLSTFPTFIAFLLLIRIS